MCCTTQHIVCVHGLSMTSCELPAVTHRASKYLAQTMIRSSSRYVPESTKTNWMEAYDNPDGKEAMAVLEKIFMKAVTMPILECTLTTCMAPSGKASAFRMLYQKADHKRGCFGRRHPLRYPI
jgi:hypothetical protein